MSNTVKTPVKSESAREYFTRLLTEVKARLPKDWKLRFVTKYPDYDTYRGGLKLHNVYNNYSSDMAILQGMQEIAADYEKEAGHE